MQNSDLTALNRNVLKESGSELFNENDLNTFTEKRVSNDSMLYATFVDGSSLKNLIEYLRTINIIGVFRFGKNYILYEQGDEDMTILNKILIKTHELTDYEFSSQSEELIAQINLTDFRNITKIAGKKDQIDIYKRPDEPDHIYVQVRSQDKSSSGENLYPLPIKISDYDEYQTPEYERSKKDPNCTIYQTDLSKFFKSLITRKCSYVKIHGFKKGIVIKGYLPDGAIGGVKEYGKCYGQQSKTSTMKSAFKNFENVRILKANKPQPILNIKEAGEIESFKIDIKTIKALTKINGLSMTGTIKIYIQKDLPLKLMCNIGTFGKISVYLDSTEDED